MNLSSFKKTIWNYYKKNRREFLWRTDTSPYSVVVSEIMLQQTQAPRVVAKYESFMKKFPNFETLAAANTAELLKEWRGLGYNSRALRLRSLARTLVEEHGGKLPRSPGGAGAPPAGGPTTPGPPPPRASHI